MIAIVLTSNNWWIFLIGAFISGGGVSALLRWVNHKRKNVSDHDGMLTRVFYRVFGRSKSDDNPEEIKGLIDEQKETSAQLESTARAVEALVRSVNELQESKVTHEVRLNELEKRGRRVNDE